METLELMEKAMKKSEQSIHLVASESWLPGEVRLPYLLDAYSRYVYDVEENVQKDENGLAETLPQFGGTEEYNEIETRCKNMLCEYLGGKYANVKPLSGLNMMISVVGSLVMKNELVLSVPIEAGGHSATKYVIERIGCKHEFIPYDKGSYNIDKEAFEKLVNEKKVKMVYIDLMNVIYRADIEGIRKIVGKNVMICYDASHVLGLIMGGQFQNPLKEGADIIIGSTHKTFPGPHKGIFVTTNRWYYMLYQLNHMLFISHTHTADICSLAMVLEKGEKFFSEYAEKVVENARTLAERLRDNGMRIYYDTSHQLWIDCGMNDITENVNYCIENGIYVNSITIPHNGHNGVRIGVQEVTYLGFEKNDMHVLGDIIAKFFIKEDSEETRSKMAELLQKQKEKKSLEYAKLFTQIDRVLR